MLSGRSMPKITSPVASLRNARTLMQEKGRAMYICESMVYAQSLMASSLRV